MGASDKRSLSMAILVIILFNTIHFRATSLKFISTNYHCNGSVHEYLIMDGIDSEFLIDSDTS